MSSYVSSLNQMMSNCCFSMGGGKSCYINSDSRLKIDSLVNSYPNATAAYENGQSRFELEIGIPAGLCQLRRGQ